MALTVADTIREITRKHLEENNGMILGQCITAVGWIQNTVPPNCRGYMELPMNDMSGPGIAIGAAIVGQRPIFVLRFQSFVWLAANYFVNHAAKTKELFGYSAPVFMRAIATEGEVAGPVHTNCYHSILMHPPGITVFAPMTPNEYQETWDYYMKHDDPMMVSEHRASYLSTAEMPDVVRADADVTLYAISAARFEIPKAVEILAQKGIKANVVHLYQLKPFKLTPKLLEPLLLSKAGLVIDSTFEICSAAEYVAYELMLQTGYPVKCLGMYDRTPGVATRLENGTPSGERIAEMAMQVVQNKTRGADRKWN